jgi:hypothetical protein
VSLVPMHGSAMMYIPIGFLLAATSRGAPRF